MHVLDHGGNLVDACMLCALAACLAFRRPEVVVGGGPTGTGVCVYVSVFGCMNVGVCVCVFMCVCASGCINACVGLGAGKVVACVGVRVGVNVWTGLCVCVLVCVRVYV